MDRRGEVWARLEPRLHVQLLRLPEKPPYKKSCRIAPAGSAFNIACSKLKQGSCLILLQNNDDAPKGGGPSKPQQFSESTPDVLSRPMLFSEGLSLDCGHFWKDRTRQCCRGNSIWNNWRRGNGATPFRPTRPVGVRPTRPDPLGSARPDPTRPVRVRPTRPDPTR